MRPTLLYCGWRSWGLAVLLGISAAAFAQQPIDNTDSIPTNFPDALTFVYRDLKPEPLRLFVVKPDDWRTNDRRPAMIYFFGGAWTRGDPSKSIGWARMVAKWGMIGIAPDYRTAERFGATPVEATADARAATRWVEDHATELGVDTNKIVVGGSSAGAHLALWTAIVKAPFGSKWKNLRRSSLLRWCSLAHPATLQPPLGTTTPGRFSVLARTS